MNEGNINKMYCLIGTLSDFMYDFKFTDLVNVFVFFFSFNFIWTHFTNELIEREFTFWIAMWKKAFN